MCAGEEVLPLDSFDLAEQLQLKPEILSQVKEAIEVSPTLGSVKVEKGAWSFLGARLPLWCSVKTYLWNTLLTAIVVIFGMFSCFTLIEETE